MRGRIPSLCTLVLCIVIGCGDDATTDAAFDASEDASNDTSTDVAVDAPRDAGTPDTRFEGLRAIQAADFDCRAAAPMDRRSTTPLDCFLDLECAEELVVGHRGTGGAFGLYAPENTLSAIRLAIALGADAVEIDVRDTADGELVLMHDASLERTTGMEAEVGAMTLAELRAVPILADGFDGDFTCETVPDFRDVLRMAHGRITLIVDTKTSRGDLVARAILEEDMIDMAFVSVAGVDKAVAARTEVPGVRIQLRPDTVEEYEAAAPMFERPAEILEVPAAEVSRFVPIAASISARLFVDIFGIDASVYTSGDLSRYEPVYADGASIAQTEFVFWLLEFLGRRDWSTLPVPLDKGLDSPLLP